MEDREDDDPAPDSLNRSRMPTSGPLPIDRFTFHQHRRMDIFSGRFALGPNRLSRLRLVAALFDPLLYHSIGAGPPPPPRTDLVRAIALLPPKTWSRLEHLHFHLSSFDPTLAGQRDRGALHSSSLPRLRTMLLAFSPDSNRDGDDLSGFWTIPHELVERDERTYVAAFGGMAEIRIQVANQRDRTALEEAFRQTLAGANPALPPNLIIDVVPRYYPAEGQRCGLCSIHLGIS